MVAVLVISQTKWEEAYSTETILYGIHTKRELYVSEAVQVHRGCNSSEKTV